MKKITSIIVALIMVLSFTVLISGCQGSDKKITVESVLNLNSDFSGTREIAFIVPSSINFDAGEQLIRDNIPTYDEDSSAFSLSQRTSGDEGNKIVFTINFSSQEDYQNKVSAALGWEASAYIARPQNVLSKGFRYVENFGTADLIHWVELLLADNENYQKLSFDISLNITNIEGQTYTIASTSQTDIKEIEGYPINSISIETINTKDSKFERRFTFSIPASTYNELGDELVNYFNSLTNTSLSNFNGWSLVGDSNEYLVIYQGLSLDELNSVTNQMLNVSDCEIFYGDKTNSSTPLSEGLNFEEKLNLFSFFAEGYEPVTLNYKYSLPSETTHGDGMYYDKGNWVTSGEWTDTTYNYSDKCSKINIVIPDGIQYSIEGIDFTLQNMGDGIFQRTTDFLYSSVDGQKGQSYAYNYFSKLGANVSMLTQDEYIICRIVNEGTPLEISVQTVALFGAGNYMNYSTDTKDFSLTINSSFKDYINISSILNAQNATKPIRYTVVPNDVENLRSLAVNYGDEKETVFDADEIEDKFIVKFTGGLGEITYKGAMPNGSAVTAYVVFISLLSILVILIMVLLVLKSKKHPNNKKKIIKNRPSKNKASVEDEEISEKISDDILNDILKDEDE